MLYESILVASKISRSIRWRSITSKCLEYSEYGNPIKVLRISERKLEITSPKQVLAKVLAAPIHPADINQIQGVYAIKPPLPAVCGNEGVVEVLETGEEVRDLSPGDWLIPAHPGFGFWRTHIVRNREDFVKVPKNIPLISAATMTVNPCTAYRMLLDYVDLKPNDVVVQNGANSGVGQSVIQLGQEMEIVTVNIVRTRPSIDDLKAQLKSLGANYVVTEEEFRAKDGKMSEIWSRHGRPRLALNCVGGLSTVYLSTCLGESGKLVSYGGMSKQPLQIPVGPLIFKNIELHGFWMTKWKLDPENATKMRQMVDFMIDFVQKGKLVVQEHETVGLEDFAKAMDKSMQGFNKKQIFLF